MRYKTIDWSENKELSQDEIRHIDRMIYNKITETYPKRMGRYNFEVFFWIAAILITSSALVLNFDKVVGFGEFQGALMVLWYYIWIVVYSVQIYKNYIKMSHTKEELKAFQQVAWGHPNSDQPVAKIIAQPEVKTLIAGNDQVVFLNPADVPGFTQNKCEGSQVFTTNAEVKITPIHNIIALENERWEWSRKTFPNDTALTLLRKLEEEIYEVRQDIYNDVRNPEEYADMIMCVFDSARRHKDSISPEEILTALAGKIAINKTRKWKQNADGTYSHIK